MLHEELVKLNIHFNNSCILGLIGNNSKKLEWIDSRTSEKKLVLEDFKLGSAYTLDGPNDPGLAYPGLLKFIEDFYGLVFWNRDQEASTGLGIEEDFLLGNRK